MDAQPETSPDESGRLNPFGRAAIIGSGSMGTLLAAVLGARMPVVMVCIDDNRAAQLFRFGARAEGAISASGRPIIVRSVDEIAPAGGASVVFVATKTTAIPAVAADLARVLPALESPSGPPFVVSFQNGIDPGRELMTRLRHERVLRMVLSLGAVLSRDGSSVRVTLDQPPHAIGSVDARFQDVCRAIAASLTAGGLETALEPDIESAVWRKAIVNAAANPVSALINAPVGDVLDSPSRAICEKLLIEGAAVARAEGIALPDDYLERVCALLETAREHLPSMVEDIRGGRESEIGQLNRQIIEHGRKLGVPTPTHDTIDALIETFDWKVYHEANASQR